MTEMVWKGAEQIRPFLRPVEDIHVHPRNPRIGDIGEIAKSLDRWGQVRLILFDAEGQIVAGNHTYLAAIDNGWTHVGAVLNDFATPQEAAAYLLADNKIGDEGEYERAEQIEMLAELEATGRWEGTGYAPDDLAHLRGLDRIANAPPPALPPEPPAGPPIPELREVVLLYTSEQKSELAAGVKVLRRRYGLEGVTETVLRAVQDEALRLNQGTPE